MLPLSATLSVNGVTHQSALEREGGGGGGDVAWPRGCWVDSGGWVTRSAAW